MKDKRFLELVNVYLDGEISEAETAELEDEIRSSAKRMDQYRRYCRMQKACMLLAQQGSEATASAGNIVRLPEARRSWLWSQWWRGGLYGGTAAVAATVILVISMSGPAQLAKDPAATPADGARTVQIPLNEFAQPKVVEPRFATLTDDWSALTRIEAITIPATVASGPQTPQFSSAPVMPEWSTSILPAPGPLEFRYRTDSFSGARVLRGQPRSDDGEVEFATFPFAR